MKKTYLCLQLIRFMDTKTGVTFKTNFVCRVNATSKHEAMGKFVDAIQDKTTNAIDRGVVDCVLIEDITLIP